MLLQEIFRKFEWKAAMIPWVSSSNRHFRASHLQKLAPEVEKLEFSGKHYVPICYCHLQICSQQTKWTSEFSNARFNICRLIVHKVLNFRATILYENILRKCCLREREPPIPSRTGPLATQFEVLWMCENKKEAKLRLFQNHFQKF